MSDVISNYPEESDLLDSDNIYPESENTVRQQMLERMSSILSDMVSLYYKHTCVKKALKGKPKSGCLRQVLA